MRKYLSCNYIASTARKFAYKIKNSDGVTLLELVVAVAILALVIAPFYAHFLQSIKIEQYAKDVIKGEYIAQKVLELEKQSLGASMIIDATESDANAIINNLMSELSKLENGPGKDNSFTTDYHEVNGMYVKTTYELSDDYDNKPDTMDSPDIVDSYKNLKLDSPDFKCSAIYKDNTTWELIFDGDAGTKTVTLGSDKDDPYEPSLKLVYNSATGNCNVWVSKNNTVPFDPSTWTNVYTVEKNAADPDPNVRMLFDCNDINNYPEEDQQFINLYVSTNMPKKVGDKKKKFKVYEIDPLDKFEILTQSSENSGIVEVYRGIDADPSDGFFGTYYWVTIDVYSSDDESEQRKLAQLHSSVRSLGKKNDDD